MALDIAQANLYQLSNEDTVITYTPLSGARSSLGVPKRLVDLLVSEEELALRRKAWRKPKHMRQRQRGYKKLYLDHVTQADKGCDFDFLEK